MSLAIALACLVVLLRRELLDRLVALSSFASIYPSSATATATAAAAASNINAASSTNSTAGRIVGPDEPYISGKRSFHIKDVADGDASGVEKTEYYLPADAGKASADAVQGVVLLAHGCKFKASVWWPRDEGCPECQGMPAEREIVRDLVRHGLVPVSLAPIANRKSSQCWADGDKNIALEVVSRVYHSLNLSHTTPFYALGIANGAIFVERMACSSLTARGGRNISAIAMMNGGIWHGVEDKTYPPLLFLCMSRNSDLCSHNNQTMHKLRGRGAEVRQVTFEPRPVTPDYFHAVGKVLPLHDSMRLQASLLQSSLLWPGSLIFIEDPLFGSYAQNIKKLVVAALPNLVPALDSFKYPNSPLAQLFSLSWAFKETTEEASGEIVRWFRSHK